MTYNSDAGTRTEIPIHKCIEEDKKNFYKFSPKMASNINLMFESLYCFNKPSDLYFFGDINLDIVSGLKISFEECDDRK